MKMAKMVARWNCKTTAPASSGGMWAKRNGKTWLTSPPSPEATGQDGSDGTDGREVELRVEGSYIQWKYDADSDWPKPYRRFCPARISKAIRAIPAKMAIPPP